jgi:hypothetical protein
MAIAKDERGIEWRGSGVVMETIGGWWSGHAMRAREICQTKLALLDAPCSLSHM